MVVFKGPSLDVYLLPGSMTIEFKQRTIVTGNPSFMAQAFVVIEYDDIQDVDLKDNQVIITLNDGSKFKVEVNDSKNLYEIIKKIIQSIKK